MYYNSALKSLRVPGFHDKDSKRFIGVIMRPATWAAATVYYLRSDDDFDIVIPTVFTGVYHKVKSPGKSSGTEPTAWATVVGEETIDGTTGLIWEAVAYNLMIPAETLSSVSYTATDGITVTNTSNTTTSFQYMIPALPAAAIATGEFTITAHYVKSNLEEDDIDLVFRVG